MNLPPGGRNPVTLRRVTDLAISSYCFHRLVKAGQCRLEDTPKLAKECGADAIEIATGGSLGPQLDEAMAGRLADAADEADVAIVGFALAADLLDEAGGHADVLVAGGPAVDAAWLVAELEARGLRRIACEGGHVLLESFARAGVVDEWNLTLSPLAAETTFRLEDEATQDGFLFTRYLRARP